jgi:hypothetical protein
MARARFIRVCLQKNGSVVPSDTAETEFASLIGLESTFRLQK